MTTAKQWTWRGVQFVVVALVLHWAAQTLASQWSDVSALSANSSIEWTWVGLASVIVLGTYAMLIQSWRMLLAGWGGRLSFWQAARIWTIANLGRYVPGKLWSIGALGVMAKREGVSGVSAASAAILGTLLNIGAGFGILALSGSQTLRAISPRIGSAATVVAVLFIIGTLALPRVLPPILKRIAAWRSVSLPPSMLPARTLWSATAMNAASWVCYGLAFFAFAKGVTPQVVASPLLFVVIWTASYLSGYLALIVPGGIGVREMAMGGAIVTLALGGAADATYLALTSRVWLTVWEIAPGVFFLGRDAIATSRGATDR
ncbi:MAG: flippase-like domain-containing protein [Gemmatimonadaceae bacterium]|nr:flippase-like domain-containing protein [Gemmatimonadaceae bacterium]